MNIGVCDDNLLDREIISDFLKDYFNQKAISYSICNYTTGCDLIYDIEDGKALDLIFLDNYMDDELGINVARILRGKMNFSGKIVFLTATVDFAVDSYEVEATGYLLKPVNTAKLSMIMDKIIKKYDTKVYRIKQRSNIITLSFDDILYIESSNSRCILHTNNGIEYIIYKRLDDIQAELNNNRFLRCHQSYLVNMNYIKNVDKQFELINGEIVCIRQRNIKAIRQEYLNYLEHRTSL